MSTYFLGRRIESCGPGYSCGESFSQALSGGGSMKGTRRTGKWVLPVCFIVPALLIVTCLTAYPLSFIVRMSVSDWTYGNPLSSARSIGLSNFRELFSGENGGLRPVSYTHLDVYKRQTLFFMDLPWIIMV